MAERLAGYGIVREILWKQIPLRAPYTVNIVTSTVCNLKCKYCVHSLPESKKRSLGFRAELMDWDMFERAAEQIGRFVNKPKSIFLYGVGEPLCNPRLPRMIRYLKERYPEVTVSFISNGILLNEANILELIDAGLDIIRISIQGLTSEKYKRMCGIKMDYERFIEILKFLYINKKQCQVYVKIIDIALEKGEEQLFYDTFDPIADRVFVEKCMPVFEGVKYSDEIQKRNITDRYGHEHAPRIVCPMTFFTLSIMPDGEVRPCDNLKSAVALGNIRKDSLDEIWHGDTLRAFWKMQLDKKRRDHEVCRECVAPDDVSQEEDELDTYAELIKKRMEEI